MKNESNIDTNAYIEKAYQLRSAYIAEGSKKAFAAVKSFFANLVTVRHSHTGRTAH